MNSEIKLIVLRDTNLSSVEEIQEIHSITKKRDLLVLANFLCSIALNCPTKFLRIGIFDDYPYVDLDNYTVYMLNTTEVEIEKGGLNFKTTIPKAMDFLWQQKTDYPYSASTYATLVIVLPRLLETYFLITKDGNTLTILYD